MTGFEYTYTSIEDIFRNITTLANFSIGEYIILGLVGGLLFFMVYVGLPALSITYSQRVQNREKKKRKKLLTQITLQREIEEEIEKEIKMKEQAKIAQGL